MKVYISVLHIFLLNTISLCHFNNKIAYLYIDCCEINYKRIFQMTKVNGVRREVNLLQKLQKIQKILMKKDFREKIMHRRI